MEEASTSRSKLSNKEIQEESEQMDEDEGDDTDEEDSSGFEEPPPRPSADRTVPAKAPKEVVRRTQLPSAPVADEGSLFTVLKKNVGKVGVSGSSSHKRSTWV
jgi:hypothetical protein